MGLRLSKRWMEMGQDRQDEKLNAAYLRAFADRVDRLAERIRAAAQELEDTGVLEVEQSARTARGHISRLEAWLRRLSLRAETAVLRIQEDAERFEQPRGKDEGSA